MDRHFRRLGQSYHAGDFPKRFPSILARVHPSETAPISGENTQLGAGSLSASTK